MSLTEVKATGQAPASSEPPQIKKTCGVLIADFNADNLASFLNAGSGDVPVGAATAPMGQVIQTLVDESHACWKERAEFAVVWTRPESVLEEFRRLLDGGPSFDAANLRDEVDAYCELLVAAKRRVGILFVPLWVVPGFRHGHGAQDLAPGSGVARTLLRINLQLLENLDDMASIYPLNTTKWIEQAGPDAHSARLWYLAKIPFGNQVFKAAAGDIKAALRGIAGRARKLIVVDLDDTLWGGVVGDVGWPNLVLGGHDPKGEAMVDFQRELKALSARGVIIGIVSKNEESTALEAIGSHPEMVLGLTDIAGWRINWGDKAQNIAELAAELNLGLDSVVFIDDNPVERDRVRAALPEVLVPEWPADPRFSVQALLTLDCFSAPSVTDEDRQRARMYVSQRLRGDLKAKVGSMEDWLESLDMEVRVEELGPENLARATQLLNKTNQMNLSTRRMKEGEFADWAAGAGREVWLVRVSDKFGDSGLTGIVSLELESERARIVDFVLSCRVMGRRIEEAMLAFAISRARDLGVAEVIADYLSTPKNPPCREIFLKSGMKPAGSDRFSWCSSDSFPDQLHIKLVDTSNAG